MDGSAVRIDASLLRKELSFCLRRIAMDQLPNYDHIMRLRRVPGLIEALIRSLGRKSAQARWRGMIVLVDLGHHPIPSDGTQSEKTAPYIDNRKVVAYLVSALSDADMAVRCAASTALVKDVPSPLLKEHTAAILAALEKHPTTDDAALLLGKTDAPAALALLQRAPLTRAQNPDQTRQALARLGDKQAEEALIRAYTASTPAGKETTAPALGYIATRRAVLTLAQDIRNPGLYIWAEPRARKSVRVDIIEGLQRAFPTEPVFFFPHFPVYTDTYYDGIEAWLTKHLGVTWTVKRPPFLWVEATFTPLRR